MGMFNLAEQGGARTVIRLSREAGMLCNGSRRQGNQMSKDLTFGANLGVSEWRGDFELYCTRVCFIGGNLTCHTWGRTQSHEKGLMFLHVLFQSDLCHS